MIDAIDLFIQDDILGEDRELLALYQVADQNGPTYLCVCKTDLKKFVQVEPNIDDRLNFSSYPYPVFGWRTLETSGQIGLYSIELRDLYYNLEKFEREALSTAPIVISPEFQELLTVLIDEDLRRDNPKTYFSELSRLTAQIYLRHV